MQDVNGKVAFITGGANGIGLGIALAFVDAGMKVVIADGLAPIVDSVYSEDQYLGWSTILGTIAFGLQIYCDFYGYSLIAKGSALLLGFELKLNFLFPYWACSITDFWRRWHVTLSSWLRDYLYIGLGGNRRGFARTRQNLLITMVLGGLWHGASFNFIYWGILHGGALVLWRVMGWPATPATRLGRAAGWAGTMLVVFAGWLLFRAADGAVLLSMLTALGHWEWFPVHGQLTLACLSICGVVGFIEYFQVRSQNPLVVLKLAPLPRAVVMGSLLFACLAMLGQEHTTFIYFQF